MQKPTDIRIFAPSSLEAFDAIAEPTLEDAAGLGILGQVISDGDQCINAMDGRPNNQLQITDVNQQAVLITGDDSSFASDTGNWNRDSGITFVGGKLHWSGSASDADATITIPVGVTDFEVTFEITDRQAGTVTPILGGAVGTTRSSNEVFTETITHGGGTTFVFDGVSNFEGDIEYVIILTDGPWRIDTALNKLKTFGFAILDRWTGLTSFPQSLRRQVQHYFHTADVFGSAVEATPNAIIAGLLGRGRAFHRYNGVDAYSIVADDAAIQFGFGDFSIVGRVLNNTDGQEFVLAKGTTGGAAQHWGIQINNDKLRFTADADTGSEGADVTSTSELSRTAFTNYAVTFDYDGAIVIYLNGVADKTETDGPYTDSFNATGAMYMGRAAWASSNFLNSSLAENIAFNRKLSAAEVLAFHNGGEIAVLDQYGGGNLITNGDMELDANWINFLTPTVHERSAAQVHSGSFSRKFTVDSASDGIQGDTFTTVTGKKYGIVVWIYPDDGTTATLAIRNGANSDFIFSESITGLTQDAWNRVEREYTEDAGGSGAFPVVNSGAQTSGTWYVDDFETRQLGAVAAYLHDGISSDQGKIFDSSTNANHATMINVEVVDGPTATDPAFMLTTFDDVRKLWAFSEFNTDGATGAGASLDTLLGLLVYGEVFDFGDLIAGGYSGSARSGVATNVSDTGLVSAELIHGPTYAWDLQWLKFTPALWIDIQRLLDIIQPGDDLSLYPFWICFNWTGEGEPIIHRVRMEGALEWAYTAGLDRQWSPIMRVVTDL